MDNGVTLQKHRRVDDVLKEANVERVEGSTKRRRIEWFSHV